MSRRHNNNEPDSGSGSGSGQDGHGEEKNTKNGPSAVGFWHPALKQVRHEVLRKWSYTTVTLMAFVFALLSIYWAVFYHLPANNHNLVIYVVDMDGAVPNSRETAVQGTPFVGPAVMELASQMMQQPNTLGFRIVPAVVFNNDPVQVRQAVYNQEAWAAIVVNPNATQLLSSAVETGNSSYDPLGACQFTWVEARDQSTYSSYITPMLNQFMTQATSTIGRRWADQALRNAGTDESALKSLAAAPQAVSPAIGFSQFNLRPFYPPTATPSVSIGLIYLIIISFFSFSFYLPVHMKYIKPDGHPPLQFWQMILWRWCATITAYLFLSLAYSLIPLAFGINFTHDNPVSSETLSTDISHGNPRTYGDGTFVVYWMLNFWGMIALGLACENVAMVIGQPWVALWLIFWVITNVASSFYDIDTEPGFFRWGYAWPLHHVVSGSRTILFDLHSRIGLHFGVLIAWAAVNTALFPLACLFMRYKSKKGIKEYWA